MAGVRPHRDYPTQAWLAMAAGVLLLGGTLLFGQIQPGTPPPDGPSRVGQPMAPGRSSEEQVVEVQVVGHKAIPLRRIVKEIRTRADRPLDMELIEEDVRRLNRTGLFVSVRPLTRRVSGGRIVIFEVAERPILQYVKYVGNEKIRKKTLAKQAEIKPGDAMDPFAVEDGRRKIEDFYHSHGFTNAHVTIFEGSQVNDRGAVYLIHEGKKQRILWTLFEGNTIASDARLRTLIQSKPGILWIFKGDVDRKNIDEDMNRLKAYYSSLGFLNARIGRELSFNENQNWLTLTFVIDEGPRYKVRDVRFIGNERFSVEELAEDTELEAGQHFNQAKLRSDVLDIQEKYGSIGYVFADVKPDIRYLEEPGLCDLVYEIEEGDRYRVGRIDVEIRAGEVIPHTKISTVLARIPLVPGDIVDTRKLRAAERRLRASGLFLTNPQQGTVPKIVFSPPELSDEEFAVAGRPKRGPEGRGQSPDPMSRATAGDRPLILTIRRDEASAESTPDASRGPVAPIQPLRFSPAPRSTAPSSLDDSAAILRRGPIARQPVSAPRSRRTTRPTSWTVRAQSADGGRSVPSVMPDSYFSQAPASRPGYAPAGDTPAIPAYHPPARPVHTGAPAGTATARDGSAFAPTQGVPVRPSPPVGNPAPLPTEPSARSTEPFFPSGVMPDGPIYSAEPPPRDLPLRAIAEEARTGRIMLGVGLNSDSGLVGSVVIDEQNFDLFRLPRSWRDIPDGTAWRGAGQRFRLELAPGVNVQRYMVSFTEPYLMHTNVSLGLSGFYYNRIYYEWSEERLGGSVRLGYQFRPDLTGSLAFRGEKVSIYDPIMAGIPDLDEALGDNALYGFRASLKHDTRDSAFMPTEGHLIEAGFEQVIGTYEYPRGDIDVRKYITLHQRPDTSGRHVLSLAARFGITGENTPIYDHYFAGGFSTLRGFDFRGASPKVSGVTVGGHMQLLGSVQYMFPVTADDVLRLVAFCDVGTVERDYQIRGENFRVAPGFGLRISIPAMGPAPLAFDFAFPIAQADGDVEEMFSFFMGMGR